MKKISLLILLFIYISISSCSIKTLHKVQSPLGNIEAQFWLGPSGEATYKVLFKGETIIDSSTLGIDFIDQRSISSNLKLIKAESNYVVDDWTMPWGEQKEVSNRCNQLTIQLEEATTNGRKFNIVFKVYDDGVGFRYEFPEQAGWEKALIKEEQTHFNLTGDHECWWIPGDWDIYEHLYNHTKVSEIDALSKQNHPNLAQTYIPNNAVNTPVTLKTVEGKYISFHEANLTDYSGMTLEVDEKGPGFKSVLVGSENHPHKVERALPFNTPWRTIQISESAGELIESNLIVNLNEPNKLGDVSWIKPSKYIGIWWEMHLGKSSWSIGPNHGATTQNAKRYIDFAANNDIDAVLVEGWNVGWEVYLSTEEDRENQFDFVTPYSDYNLDEVVAYAKNNGVDILMHHETNGAPRTYEKQMEAAYELMQKHQMHAVKTGYVGKIIPEGEYHHGQWMVNHYRKVLETAAKYKVAINAHEPIKATGIRRTYPNAISREGLRGQEFNAWSMEGGNPPNHLPTVAFTRMLSGPIDFTPGIFDIKLNPYKPDNQIKTTLAHQLALYVVIYSPVQMAADLPEHYEGHPAFQFIRDVAVDWEETKVLNGEIGEFVTIARKERDGNRWFLGSITNENSRSIKISFDFLEKDQLYLARIYQDGENADWKENPTSYLIEEKEVNQGSNIEFMLAEGGGLAISLEPK